MGNAHKPVTQLRSHQTTPHLHNITNVGCMCSQTATDPQCSTKLQWKYVDQVLLPSQVFVRTCICPHRICHCLDELLFRHRRHAQPLSTSSTASSIAVRSAMQRIHETMLIGFRAACQAVCCSHSQWSKNQLGLAQARLLQWNLHTTWWQAACLLLFRRSGCVPAARSGFVCAASVAVAPAAAV